MWILNFLPTWIFYAVVAVGCAGLIASYVLGAIPLINRYKLPLQILSIIVIVVGTFFAGGVENELSWQAKVKEMEEKVAAAEVKSKQANNKIQQRVVTKIEVVEKQVEVIKREVEIKKEIINAECKINDTAVELYNKAVSDPNEVNK